MRAARPPGRVVVVGSPETVLRWARRLRAAGVAASPCAWCEVEATPTAARAGALVARRRPAYLLVTSANAVRWAGPFSPPRPPVVAVGPRAARAARARGLRVALTGPSTGEALARALLASVPRPCRVVWLRGREAATGAAEVLRDAGWTVDEIVTYATVARAGFAQALRRRLPAAAWVVGSPAAARAIVEALGEDAFPPRRGGAPVYVPGETTAAALRRAGRPAPVTVPGLPEGLADRVGARPAARRFRRDPERPAR